METKKDREAEAEAEPRAGAGGGEKLMADLKPGSLLPPSGAKSTY
jgi:hypothetical protein